MCKPKFQVVNGLPYFHDPSMLNCSQCPDVSLQESVLCKHIIKMEHPPVPSKTWELSLYEQQRTPQEAITDATEIAVSPRSLHSELMCPICLDMLKNTMTTKECLHRFCQECIITALRSGNKECPTCRKKLVSKRSLRPDPNFDALISKIYPSRDEYEAHQERVLAKLKQHHNTNAFSNSIEEGLRLQALNRAQRVRKQANDSPDLLPGSGPATPASSKGDTGSISGEVTPHKRGRAPSEDSADIADNVSVASTEDGASVNSDLTSASDINSQNNLNIVPSIPAPPPPQPNEIELIFKPHPNIEEFDPSAQTRYIKTTANATGLIIIFSSFYPFFLLT